MAEVLRGTEQISRVYCGGKKFSFGTEFEKSFYGFLDFGFPCVSSFNRVVYGVMLLDCEATNTPVEDDDLPVPRWLFGNGSLELISETIYVSAPYSLDYDVTIVWGFRAKTEQLSPSGVR